MIKPDLAASKIPEELKAYIEFLESKFSVFEEQKSQLENQNCQLEQQKSQMEQEKESLDQEILRLRELVAFFQRELYGPSSEQLPPAKSKQLEFAFNEAELTCDEEEPELETVTYRAKKPSKAGRKPIPAQLPRKEIIHDLPESEKLCPCCRNQLPELESVVTEQLDIIPAKIIVQKHIQKKYGPCACKKDKKKPEIITAKKPVQIIPGSIATPGLLAYVLTSKFCDSVPFYRQEGQYRRIGVEISRQNLCNWAIGTSEALQDLIELMWQEVRSGPLINMDETPLQVLKEPGRPPQALSWMWLTLGWKPSGKPIVLFHYHQSRSQEVAKSSLAGFKGYLQTDGYAAYNSPGSREGMTHVGCWAHVRRKFFDALKTAGGKGGGTIREALGIIDRIFVLQEDLFAKLTGGTLSLPEFTATRKLEAQKIFDHLKSWLEKHQPKVPPASLLGKAISYTVNQWPKLIRFVEKSFLRPDNNLAENAIRPFVIGRKNWLFADTPRGAHASAALYSIIETAKMNSLEPYWYLRYLLEKLPQQPKDKLAGLLPYNLKPEVITDYFKTLGN